MNWLIKTLVCEEPRSTWRTSDTGWESTGGDFQSINQSRKLRKKDEVKERSPWDLRMEQSTSKKACQQHHKIGRNWGNRKDPLTGENDNTMLRSMQNWCCCYCTALFIFWRHFHYTISSSLEWVILLEDCSHYFVTYEWYLPDEHASPSQQWPSEKLPVPYTQRHTAKHSTAQHTRAGKQGHKQSTEKADGRACKNQK